jgi:hypothetical protein
MALPKFPGITGGQGGGEAKNNRGILERRGMRIQILSVLCVE